jgi:hypothetical protein
MSGSRKDLRDLIRELEAAGWHVERTNKGHYGVSNKEGKLVYSLPGTPGRGRALQNLRAALRRKGILQ